MTGTRPIYRPQPPVPLRQQLRTYAGLLRPRRAADSQLHPTSNPTSFVIFAQGRTGSTLLTDLLRSHIDVHCDEEILGRRVLLPNAWVRAHRLRMAGKHYGFKVKVYQLTTDQRVDPGRWLTRMHQHGWQLVYLWRRNVLRQALSNMVAEKLGAFVLRTSGPTASDGITVDVNMLMGAMAARSEQRQLEQAALVGLPHTSVCYEDDLQDADCHQRTLDRLSAALGLPTATARTSVRRITNNSLRRTIANYDEVAAAVAASPWAELLSE